jgi:SAM-dependent methyltransferase
MIEDEDTGSALRSLYEPQGGVRAIFASKVADYIASRPDYPDALFDALAQNCGLPDGATIADIGAGTGLLTQGLLTRGYRTVAVEPNPAMRAACDLHCTAFAGYRSVEGCAESIPLGAGSVDLITAAQAFHWFEVERARAECLRVLAPHGRVALIWNDRVSSDPLHVELDGVFARFGGAKRSALVAHEDRSDVPRFFSGAPVEALSWPHEHRIGAEGLACLAFSRSYMPDRATPDGQAVARELRRIFGRFEVNAAVTVRYRTILILGRPDHSAPHLNHD